MDVGFPIAEIMSNGSCYITKQQDMAGKVTAASVTAQLLYELQGEMYLNSDVVADIRTVQISSTDAERREVFVSGVKGHPPPSTTKVMVAAPGGYQAETVYYMNGLDISEKAEMMKRQLTSIFQGNTFSKLSTELYGGQAISPKSQAAGTAMLRVFAQAKNKEDISASKFRIPIYSLRMQSYPGQFVIRIDHNADLVQPILTLHMIRLSHESGLSHPGSEAFHGDLPDDDAPGPNQPHCFHRRRAYHPRSSIAEDGRISPRASLL